MLYWLLKNGEYFLYFLLCLLPFSFSDCSVNGEEEEEEAGLSSSSPTTSEIPAGSKLFYALVVTGRFIRLEICTNQLSFRSSCQCVKLSGPAVREMPQGAERGGNRPEKKMSSNRPEKLLYSTGLSPPVETPSISLDVEQQRAQKNDMAHCTQPSQTGGCHRALRHSRLSADTSDFQLNGWKSVICLIRQNTRVVLKKFLAMVVIFLCLNLSS